MSQDLESSVEQRRQDDAFNEPAGTESDSGDSLFITQKPVAEPVRTAKRHRSDPTFPRDLEEREDDASCSSSRRKSTARKKNTLPSPKWTFPFLKVKKRKHRGTFLTVQKTTRLSNATMGGFFQCVRELWQGYESGNMELCLPTVDMDGQNISPLTEEEEERSEEEDIKVVKKKCFLAPSKAKSSQPWYTPAKTDDQINQQRKRRRKDSNTSQDLSQESQWKMPFKIPAKASVTRATVSSSNTDNCDGGGPCRVVVERETDDKHETSESSFIRQTPKMKTRLTRGNKKILFQKKEREEELSNDSDAAVCEPLQLQGNLREHTQGGREAAITIAEGQADVSHTEDLSWTEQEEEEHGSQSLPQFLGDTNNDSVCTATMVQKKKKKKVKRDHTRVEEGRGQSQEEPKGLHAAASVNANPEETFSLPENSRAKPLALETCDELEHSENYLEDAPHSNQMKRKRKKSKSTVENIRQGMLDKFESSVTEDSEVSVMCNIENADQVKKKKKISVEDDECVEQLQPRAVTETLNDDAETLEKIKKKKVTGEYKEADLENNEFSLETLQFNFEKKRRKHKKNKLSSSLDDTQIGEDVAKVSSSKEGVTFEGNTGQSVKKKKKREGISEGEAISYATGKSKRIDDTDNSQTTIDGSEARDTEHVTKKKKKKKKIEKMNDKSCREVPEDTMAQSGDAVYVQKKEKNRTTSFLKADSQEQAQLLQQQHSCLKSVAAGVWGVEKVFSHVETESTEITGNSGERVSKKKKKRKRKTSATQDSVEEDHEPDFEDVNKTCESALTDTGVKRKKKRKTTESESVTPKERLDSAGD